MASIERLPFPAEYTESQQAAIDSGIESMRPASWMQYDNDGVIFELFSRQLFAVYRWAAYELQCQRLSVPEDGVVIEYLPAIVNGHAILQSPDEGRTGVLHIMRFTEHPRRAVGSWVPVWTHGGWLRPDELLLSSAEIADRIAHEVLRGETPITGGRHGWA